MLLKLPSRTSLPNQFPKSSYIYPLKIWTKKMTAPKPIAPTSRQNKLSMQRRLAKPLSKFELEIIKLVYDEKTSSEIGVILGKSRRTIQNSRSIIVKKIGCKGPVGIVKYAIEHKIV